MKNATHAPVAARGFAPGVQQEEAEPRQFFVNGGGVRKAEDDPLQAMRQQEAASNSAAVAAGEAASRPQLERETPSRIELIRPEFVRPDFEHPASPRADLPMRGETPVIERLRLERTRPELPPRPR